MWNLWWTLGFGCVGLVVLAVLALVLLGLWDRRKRDALLERGEPTVGWLVQANVKLFEEGFLDLPALVLISPDPVTARNRDFMLDLAERVFDLKGVEPDDCEDEDEAYVADLMADETYVEGRRDQLPSSMTGGKEVYLAHLWVNRDDLPGKRLRGRRLPCVVLWEEPNSPIITRPSRRRPEDEG